MTFSFACSFLHPHSTHCMQNATLGALPIPCAKCTSASESSTASAPISLCRVKPLFYDFHPYCTCRTLLRCPCLQLSIKHTLHFVIALHNSVWPTNCFKFVCLTFQANLQGISEQHKNKYLKWLNSPMVPGTRLGTQETLHHFLSTDSPGHPG